MAIELAQRGLRFERQAPLPARYKGVPLGDAYRLDLLVEGCVIVEIKAVARLAPIHASQLLTYLRLSQCRLGLLRNFHERTMRAGIQRVVNDL